MVASYVAYSDPMSGAAKSLIETIGILRDAGWTCSALTGPRFDTNKGVRPPGALPYLRQQGFRPKLSSSLNIKVKHSLLDYTHDRTPVTTYAPVHSGTGPPSAEDSAGFVSLVERQLDTQRPDVIVTYGGGKFVAPTRGVLQAAAARGIPAVFWLRNEHYAYDGYKAFFDLVAGTIVPSPFLRDYYRQHLGIEATSIPPPVRVESVRAPEGSPRDALVFVNPSFEKGACVAARIFGELQTRGPHIPLLVVEARGSAENVFSAGVPLERERIEVMTTTPNPIDFYRRARVLLCPSVWAEAFMRVGVEGLVNGVPVVASRRGGIPQTLSEAGIVLDIPAAYTEKSRVAPTAAEVQPWVDAILRLWDDDAFYESECRRAERASHAYSWESIALEVLAFFTRTIESRSRAAAILP